MLHKHGLNSVEDIIGGDWHFLKTIIGELLSFRNVFPDER
jgi:hypothetical protein